MKDINHITLLGRMGSDPVLRKTKSGLSVAELSMATSEFYKSSDQEGDWKERTTWHRIVVWGRLAEACTHSLKKGSPLYVDGALRIREYTDSQNIKRRVAEVHAERVSFVGQTVQLVGGKASPTPAAESAAIEPPLDPSQGEELQQAV